MLSGAIRDYQSPYRIDLTVHFYYGLILLVWQ